MAAVDLLQWIRDGRAHVKWGHIVSEHKGHKLVLSVMRDAMTFDGVPPMTWSQDVLPGPSHDGVRMATNARKLQEIADAMYCMPLTPKVLDLVWDAAGKPDGTRFESVVNIHGQIVAVSHVHVVHEAVEAALGAAGGDRGGFIASVGKYWVLCNTLLRGKFGKLQAVNYGWYSHQAPNPSVTGNGKVWQGIGARHDVGHFDPSQVIRLMYRQAKLLRAGSSDWEDVDLVMIAADPELAPLISHEGVLKVTRMPCVDEPQPTTAPDGAIVMPELLIVGEMPDVQPLLDSLMMA